MPNFGTYEGHRILSDAMDKTIAETARKQEFKEQQKNNEIARRFKTAQANEIDLKMKHDALVKSGEDLTDRIKKDQSSVYNEPLFSDDGGFNQNAADIINRTSNQSSPLYTEQLDPDKVLTFDQRKEIEKSSDDPMTQLLKKFQRHYYDKTSQEIDADLYKNPDAEKALHQMLIDKDVNLDGATLGQYIRSGGEPTLGDGTIDPAEGWGQLITVQEDDKTTGGAIKFEGLQGGRTVKSDREKDLLIEALKESKRNEEGTGWFNDMSDNTTIKQTGDGWKIIENDNLFTGGDQIFDIQIVNVNGVDEAQIKNKETGEFQKLSGFTSKDWE
tara:strand:- start:2005 stop:2991 length:987 start_codon:yes stop_codon:yes gene_type:complete